MCRLVAREHRAAPGHQHLVDSLEGRVAVAEDDIDRSVGAHGWMHESWDRLRPDEERDLIARATGAIGDALGQAPRGWHSPAA